MDIKLIAKLPVVKTQAKSAYQNLHLSAFRWLSTEPQRAKLSPSNVHCALIPHSFHQVLECVLSHILL